MVRGIGRLLTRLIAEEPHLPVARRDLRGRDTGADGRAGICLVDPHEIQLRRRAREVRGPDVGVVSRQALGETGAEAGERR